jgi:DNA-binding protein HU-beta
MRRKRSIKNNKLFLPIYFLNLTKVFFMRKADIVNSIAEKTGVPKVDILVALESFFKEVKSSLIEGEPVFVRGFGSFILKKRAAKIGRNIKKNVAVEIPEHFVPAFKPAKEFVTAVKGNTKNLKIVEERNQKKEA